MSGFGSLLIVLMGQLTSFCLDLSEVEVPDLGQSWNVHRGDFLEIMIKTHRGEL